MQYCQLCQMFEDRHLQLALFHLNILSTPLIIIDISLHKCVWFGLSFTTKEAQLVRHHWCHYPPMYVSPKCFLMQKWVLVACMSCDIHTAGYTMHYCHPLTAAFHPQYQFSIVINISISSNEPFMCQSYKRCHMASMALRGVSHYCKGLYYYVWKTLLTGYFSYQNIVNSLILAETAGVLVCTLSA